MNTPPTPSSPPTPQELHSPILSTVARLAVPLTLYVALIIFFQGHNKPGGGFIAGVLAAAAGVVGLLAYGPHNTASFPRIYVPILALLIFPTSGYCASALTLIVGLGFHFAVCRFTIAEFPWWKMACVGLLISITTGLVPLVAGYAFMDHTVWHTHLPILGNDHLPSATFFDLGVFLIVMGTLTTIFVELGLEGDQ